MCFTSAGGGVRIGSWSLFKGIHFLINVMGQISSCQPRGSAATWKVVEPTGHSLGVTLRTPYGIAPKSEHDVPNPIECSSTTRAGTCADSARRSLAAPRAPLATRLGRARHKRNRVNSCRTERSLPAVRELKTVSIQIKRTFPVAGVGGTTFPATSEHGHDAARPRREWPSFKFTGSQK